MSTEGQETLKTYATLVGLLVIVGGVFFAAGNYPTRSEWESSRKDSDAQVDQLKENVNNMKLEQVKLRASMTAIEKSQDRSEGTQNEIRQTLDKTLEKLNSKRKR